MRFKSIKTRLIILTGLCMIVAAAVMTGSMVYSVRQTSVKAARGESISLARGNAAKIKAEIESALDASRTLAQMLSSVKDAQNALELNRQDAAVMLKRVLQENPKLIRVYSVWEPDAFDGKDSNYAGKSGYDESGRFVVCWERDSQGEVVRVPLTTYAEEGKNDYYTKPQESLQDCVLEPFRASDASDAPYLTSLVSPVQTEGEFFGIVGVDLSLEPFQEMADELDIYDGTGQLVLISHEGTLAAVTGNRELRGKTMAAFYKTSGMEDKLAVIQDGSEIAISQEGQLEIYAPVLIGETESPWAASIVVPLSKITVEATRLMWEQILISLVMLAIALAALWYIARRIAQPLVHIATGAQLLALGDTEMEGIDRAEMQRINSRPDELGEIGRAFQGLIEAQKAKVDYAEHIARGDMSLRIKAASDKDVLGNSMIEMIKSLKNMNQEVVRLIKAAVDGQLDIRADVTKHKGEYAEIVKGINDLLDSVVDPINSAADVLESAAAKDLTKRVSGNYKGRFAELMENINTTVESLNSALGQVAETVEAVSLASGEINAGSRTLAEGASEQASALEQVSSSLEQMSSMTTQNADNAEQAKALSTAARELAQKGKLQMERMIEAIGRIKTSSSQTAKIVKTIDEIAFQTNLLALNAAVEAARAGDAGKGFAVVAEEVRSLAQRSAEAARNTSGMIEEAVKNAEGGVNITEKVAEILNEIVDSSNHVNDLVAEIAASAQEQAQGIEQINNGVAQMDSVTQSNASNSEESSASSEELKSRAELLRTMISEFRLFEEDEREEAAPPSQLPKKTEKPMLAEPVRKTLPSADPAKSNPKREQVVKSMLQKTVPTVKPPVKEKPAGDGNGKKKADPEKLIPLDENDFKDF